MFLYLEVVLQAWCIHVLDLANLKHLVISGFKLYISGMAKCVQIWNTANTVQTVKGHDDMLKSGPRLC